MSTMRTHGYNNFSLGLPYILPLNVENLLKKLETPGFKESFSAKYLEAEKERLNHLRGNINKSSDKLKYQTPILQEINTLVDNALAKSNITEIFEASKKLKGLTYKLEKAYEQTQQASAAPKTTPTPPLAATATNQPVSPQTTPSRAAPAAHEFVEVRWEGLSKATPEQKVALEKIIQKISELFPQSEGCLDIFVRNENEISIRMANSALYGAAEDSFSGTMSTMRTHGYNNFSLGLPYILPLNVENLLKKLETPGFKESFSAKYLEAEKERLNHLRGNINKSSDKLKYQTLFYKKSTHW